MDPSPRKHHQRTCAKPDLSEIDPLLTLRHVDASGASDLHRKGEINGKHGSHPMIVGHHVASSDGRNSSRFWHIEERQADTSGAS